MKNSENGWLEDFKEFVETENTSVPVEVSKSVLNRVRADLNPSAWTVFVKLVSVHLIVGTASLALCAQFGLNPFGTDFSLSDVFMQFGHSTCMILCGLLFITLTILFGSLVLRREERLVLSRNAWLQVFGLSTLSLAAFIGFGAEVLIGVGVFWLAGAMIGGITSVKLLAYRPV